MCPSQLRGLPDTAPAHAPPTSLSWQKCALMEQVAHQTMVMQFILELAKSLKVDPRACFRQFFTKIKVMSSSVPPGNPQCSARCQIFIRGA